MSRIIKFRSWLKEKEKMLYDFGTISEHPLLSESKEIVLMQYTGIKDGDNSEIWEGDIVEFTSTLCGDKLIKTVVEYNENIGSFVFEMGNNEGFWQYDASMNNIKVIGNIYEQSELIKER